MDGYPRYSRHYYCFKVSEELPFPKSQMFEYLYTFGERYNSHLSNVASRYVGVFHDCCACFSTHCPDTFEGPNIQHLQSWKESFDRKHRVTRYPETNMTVRTWKLMAKEDDPASFWGVSGLFFRGELLVSGSVTFLKTTTKISLAPDYKASIFVGNSGKTPVKKSANIFP